MISGDKSPPFCVWESKKSNRPKQQHNQSHSFDKSQNRTACPVRKTQNRKLQDFVKRSHNKHRSGLNDEKRHHKNQDFRQPLRDDCCDINAARQECAAMSSAILEKDTVAKPSCSSTFIRSSCAVCKTAGASAAVISGAAEAPGGRHHQPMDK